MPGRSNGLQALAYAPVTDLDPRLADTVLDALRRAGIAAYVVPSPGETGGYRDVHLPDRPKDRLWADASAIERARVVVDTTLPPGDPPPLDEDAEWRAIVAAFEEGPATPVPPWPVSEDLDEPRTPTPPPVDPRHRRGDPRPGDPRGGVLRWREGGPVDPWLPAARRPEEQPAKEHTAGEDTAAEDTPKGDAAPPAPPVPGRDADPVEQAADDATPPVAGPDEDGEHFVPPPPPPLPRADPVTVWAWVALIGGIALLLAPVTLRWTLEGWMALLAVAGIVGGFVTLVARLGDGPPRDSGPDDGAVV